MRYVVYYPDDDYREEIEAPDLTAAKAQVIADVQGAAWEWEDGLQTLWVRYQIFDEDQEKILAEGEVRVDPEPPKCSHPDGHDWCSPHEVVGGLEENPGVFGHGGGVIVYEVCRYCGAYKVTDTWDPVADRNAEVVEYRDPDEDSLRWVTGQARSYLEEHDQYARRILADVGESEDPAWDLAEFLEEEGFTWDAAIDAANEFVEALEE